MDIKIWILVIALAVIILIVTLLTSVTSLHKRFIEKFIERKERE